MAFSTRQQPRGWKAENQRGSICQFPRGGRVGTRCMKSLHTACTQRGRNPRGTHVEHMRNTRGTHAEPIQNVHRACTGRVQGVYRACTGHVQGVYRAWTERGQAGQGGTGWSIEGASWEQNEAVAVQIRIKAGREHAKKICSCLEEVGVGETQY